MIDAPPRPEPGALAGDGGFTSRAAQTSAATSGITVGD